MGDPYIINHCDERLPCGRSSSKGARLLRQPPAADTAMFGGGVHALRCGYGFFGTPLGPIKPAIDALKQLDIAAADRRKIFAGNAERLPEEKGELAQYGHPLYRHLIGVWSQQTAAAGRGVRYANKGFTAGNV